MVFKGNTTGAHGWLNNGGGGIAFSETPGGVSVRAFTGARVYDAVSTATFNISLAITPVKVFY